MASPGLNSSLADQDSFKPVVLKLGGHRATVGGGVADQGKIQSDTKLNKYNLCRVNK